jgi:two-component system chemotaxis response regulator CheY
MTEQRTQARFPLTSNNIGRFSSFQRFHIEDICTTGLRVRSNFADACGSRCRIFLEVSGDWREFLVEVVRVELAGFCDQETEVFHPGSLFSVALRFMELDPAQRQHLVRLIENSFSSLPEPKDFSSFTSMNPILIPEEALIAKRKILVVDDEECIRQMLTDVLKGQGYEVVQAVDGEDACAQFSTHGPEICLVTLDIGMPRLNGYQAYRRIRALDANVKVLFITGAIHFPRQQIDGADWMEKPFLIDTLIGYIGQLKGPF